MNQDQLQKIRSAQGFIAALDQSGGSTPKALEGYGIMSDTYTSEFEMFTLVHEMRTRIITNSVFNGERILGAILFENTMDRKIEGMPTAKYLWEKKGIVPFLKIDKGMKEEEHDVQVMKEIPSLDSLLQRAKENSVFGTKMRSYIKQANKHGIAHVVAQQFAFAKQILRAGLMPIVEPEVSIHAEEKELAEDLLKAEIHKQLDLLPEGQQVMLKLTLPSIDNFYKEFVEHPKVLKVVALSGGYSREEANRKVAANSGVIASFSRALLADLRAQQNDQEFEYVLDQTIQSIYEASNT